MFLAYIGKYTYNENMKKDVHICVIQQGAIDR